MSDVFVLLGIAIIMFVIGLFESFDYKEETGLTANKALLAECEKALPRTQTCVLIAVPKED